VQVTRYSMRQLCYFSIACPLLQEAELKKFNKRQKILSRVRELDPRGRSSDRDPGNDPFFPLSTQGTSGFSLTGSGNPDKLSLETSSCMAFCAPLWRLAPGGEKRIR